MVAPSSLLFWTSTTSNTSMDGADEKPCLMRDFNGGGGGGGGEPKNVRGTTTTSRGSSSRNKSGKVLARRAPQRGLGVAQLERLRIQERWKKMTELDAGSTTPQSHINHHQFPFQEQQNIISSVPVAGFASPIFNSSPQPPATNFVFNPYRTSGGSSGIRSVFSDHVQFQAGNGNNHYHHHPFETAPAPKEFSSSQKSSSSSSHCLFDQCDVCLKKKRMMNGENLGFEDGGRSAAQYLERKSFDGCDFLGLDLGRNWTSTVNGHNQNEFCVRGDGNQIRRASYSPGITTINDDQEEVEVVAVHRKGKTSSIGGGGGGGEGEGGGGSSSSTVLMEYDFFPRKASSSSTTTRSSRSVIKKEPVSLFGEASSVKSSSSVTTTNLLDLSLKLSC